MVPQDKYRQWLNLLDSKSEPKAAEALQKVLLKGTPYGGLSFARADIHSHFEHVHHYYGCPEDKPCDRYDLDEPLSWEKEMLVPIEEALHHTLPMAVENYMSWLDIGTAVLHFGDSVRDRWLSKNVSQRKAILLKARPSLPPKHRPDIDQCVLGRCPHQSSGGAQYAFPHLNIEDLTKPNSLLILLDARAKNPPHKFALSDHELAPLIKLRPNLLEKTMYTMRVSNNEYGMIKEWDSQEIAAKAIAKGYAIHPVHGMHTLALQAGMYRFLGICIGEIIADKIDLVRPNPLKNESLIQTWSFLELIKLDLIQQLKVGWPASLELRKYFAQDCGPGDESIVLGIKRKHVSSRKRDKELEHIFQLFKYLWDPPPWAKKIAWAAMASRNDSAREPLTQPRAAPGSHAIRVLKTSSENERQTFLARLAQKTEDTNNASEQITSIEYMPTAQQMAALATLPKRDQDMVLSQMSERLDTAVSYGDPIAELVAMRYQDELNYLCARKTEHERLFEETAEFMVRQGLNKLPIPEYRKQCRSMVTELLRTWEVLRMILQSYEALIQKRWLKETPTRKREILLKAWPNMPEGHRPDMAKVFKDGCKSVQQVLSDCVWPYINIEDLSGSKALLIFLNSRGRNHPADFAYSDLELAPLYKTRKEIIAVFGKKHTMSFIGSTDPSTYGAWIEWTTDQDALNSIRTGRTVHVEHGYQILTIQARVMTFLLDCVLQILSDKDMFQLPPVLPEPGQLSGQNLAFKSMEVIAREAPYRLPSQLDLTRLYSLVRAQRLQAIDHAWALQEDPGYFADTTEEYREHHIELVLNESGGAHPHASNFPLYNKAVRHMAADAHCLVFIWDEIDKRISQLQKLWSTYSETISAEKDLPIDLHTMLVELRFFIDMVTQNLISDIKHAFWASPALRGYHYRANQNDQNLRRHDIRTINLGGNDPSVKHILDLRDAICDVGRRDLLTLHALLDEFERLMRDDPRARSLISAHLAKDLSQISVLAECLHHLHQFQPWAHKVESDIEENKIKLLVTYNKTFKHWGRIHQEQAEFEDGKLYKLCNPHDGKFEYPVHLPPSRVRVDKMRSAEAALDAFWKGANRHWLSVVRTTPTTLVKHIMGERTLRRTQPWAEMSKGAKLPKNPATTNMMPEPFSGHIHDVTKQITGGTVESMSYRSKTKTRGATNEPEIEEAHPDAVPTVQTSTRPTFKVDKRSLKVFRTLFHCPNSPDQPGEVVWTNLLHAMTSLGFGAEKLRSSAWQFTPPPAMAERPIQLHEPHPSNKLPFVLARHYGRRLNIAFQWTIESFELAK
ncbi:hypothetical protein N0V94_006327 [Neodidymelliopsis sp. IMI 364377]|nr:hypothetical protein N0V94_006327 [Neodidymelliopsis sp. IMI 364377]